MKKIMTTIALTSIMGASLVTPLKGVSVKAMEERTNFVEIKPAASYVNKPIGVNLISQDFKMVNNKFKDYQISESGIITEPDPSKTPIMTNDGGWLRTSINPNKGVSTSNPFGFSTRDFGHGTHTYTHVSTTVKTEPGKLYHFKYDANMSNSGNFATSPQDSVMGINARVATYSSNVTYKKNTYSLAGNSAEILKKNEEVIEFRATSDKTVISAEMSYLKIGINGGYHFAALNNYSLKEIDEAVNQEARQAIANLFVNNEVTGTINNATDQTTIDAANKLLDAVISESAKADLQSQLNEAQKQLDERNVAVAAEKARQEAAETSIKNLFNNDNVNGTIKDTTDQEAIDNAKSLANAVTDPTKKAELQNQLAEVQNQLDTRNQESAAEKARQEAAETSIKNLFNNDNVNGTIKDTTDQEAIDNAKSLANAVTDPTKKAELQNQLAEVQNQLDTRNQESAAEKARQEAAETSIKNLFNNDNVNGTIKDTTDQEAIDNAKNLANAVTDPTKKAELQNQLNKAQELLNERNNVLDAPGIDPYTYADSFVTGKVAEGTATISLYINGTRVKRATPDASGNYKIDAYGLGLNEGVTFEVRPVDAKGKEGTPTFSKVQNKDAESNILTANDATLSSTLITGTVGNVIDNVRLSIDGVIVKVGQITNGTYSIATNNLIKEGSVVQVVGYSSNKVELARVTVQLIKDEKPVLSALTVDDEVLTGSIIAGSAERFRVSINGVPVKTGIIEADGTFQSIIGKQKVGTEVKIEIRDETGYNPLRVSTVIVTESAVSKLAAPTLLHVENNYVTGKTVKGTENIVIYEDGVAKRTVSAAQMTTNPDGSLTFRSYVDKAATNIQAVAKNRDKRMTSEMSEGITR